MLKKSVGLFAIIFLFSLVAAFPAVAADSPWGKRCNKAEKDKKEYCEIVQRLDVKAKDAQGKAGPAQRFAEFAIGYPEKDKDAQGVLILPLGIRVDTPVALSVSIKKQDKKLTDLIITHCLQEGCIAPLVAGDGIIENFKTGEYITIRLTALNGKKLDVQMALSGFTKALKSIQ